ncbi:hypothetical protein QAD02_014002 [Eretmocerus hayati]|uniref:Uncharacterized protein n=1 Tax=Eretmocerus hayati TaxID=131215 RepID=A0ACC2P4A5_9HYME|nr:hypothetical protein QAD02_014002 [Eretmocerus hayati]
MNCLEMAHKNARCWVASLGMGVQERTLNRLLDVIGEHSKVGARCELRQLKERQWQLLHASGTGPMQAGCWLWSSGGWLLTSPGRCRCSDSGRPGAVLGVTNCGELCAAGAADLGPTAQVGRCCVRQDE